MTPTPSPAPKSISLAQLHIKEPCHVDWNAMAARPGDDSKRFCAQCEKHVHNLDALTQQEIDALFEEHQGKLCVRYTPPSVQPAQPPSPALTIPAKRRPLLTAISRIAAAILLSSTLGFSGCGRTPSASSAAPAPTIVERFNDWRFMHAPHAINSLLDPFLGSSFVFTTMGKIIPAPAPIAGGISIVPTTGAVYCPPPSTQPTTQPAAILGESDAIPRDRSIKGDVYCPPPSTQPTTQPAPTVQGGI